MLLVRWVVGINVLILGAPGAVCAQQEYVPQYDYSPPSDSQRLETFVLPPPPRPSPSVFDQVRDATTYESSGGTTVRPTIIPPCCGSESPPAVGVEIGTE